MPSSFGNDRPRSARALAWGYDADWKVRAPFPPPPPNLRVPAGDREDSLGLSEAMPQDTDQPHRGVLKGRESLTTTDFPTEGQTIFGLGAVGGTIGNAKGGPWCHRGFMPD